MNLKSIASEARPGSTSLRATIPEGIVAFLDLKTGDKLEWKMEVQGNERMVVIRKLGVR